MDYSKLNKIHEELAKVKVCLGSRYTSPFYTSINGLKPNKNGSITPAEPTNMRDVMYYMMNGNFVNLAKKQQSKQPDKPLKYFAKSIFPFDDNRYTIEEKVTDDNDNIVTIKTNTSFYKFNGFQGFDIDSDKEFYTQEQVIEIGLTLKKICHEKLSKYDWFIGSTLSTGGKGTHIYTATKFNNYYIDDIDEIIRLYHLNFQMKAFAIFECLVELTDRLDYVDLNYTIIDDAMDKPSQTINITVCDDEPLLNENFEFVADDTLTDFFNHGYTHVVVDDDIRLMLNETQKRQLDEYEKWYESVYEKGLKSFEKTSNDKKIVVESYVTDDKSFDLDKSKGPFYFRHSANADEFWTGNQVINTLLYFFDKETVKQIWRHPKFYTKDPSSWIRFVDSWHTDYEITPNFALVDWLNKNCGFDLKYHRLIHKKTEEEMYDNVIRLNDDEFLGDYEDVLFGSLKIGINLIISGTGTGKTTIWKNRNERIQNDYLNIVDAKTTIITEPYNAVLDTKFSDDEYSVFKGSKHLSWDKLPIGLCAVNYKKLIELDDGDDEDWNKIDYIVIDESHLLTKEYFRSDDLLKMIEFIKTAARHVPVVLMTGTPIDEIEIFDDINTIKVIKRDNRKIYYKNVRFLPDRRHKTFDMSMLLTLIKNMYEEDRKIYIYDSNISLRKCKLLRDLLNNMNVCIYHKRHIDDVSGNDDMKYIDEHHQLGDKFDVIISSCYFGVGNDLNDDCDAACIIIGNHIWQEDIQIIGRWRNSPDIKVYNIYMPDDEENMNELDKKSLLENNRRILETNYFDASVRDKNIVIKSNIIKINNYNDIKILALMRMCELYNSSIKYKHEMFSDYYVDVDINQVQPLYWNENDIELSKKIKKEYSDEDKKRKISTLYSLQNNDGVDWNNTDKRIKDWQRNVSYIYHNDYNMFTEILKNDWVMFNKNNDALSLLVRMMKNKSNGMVDFAEIKSFEFVRKIHNDGYSDNVIEKCDKINVEPIDYYIACAYSYMIHNANFGEEAAYFKVNGDYFWRFRRYCKSYLNFSDGIVNELGFDIDFDEDIERVRDHTISIHNDMYVVNQCLQILKNRTIKQKKMCAKTGGEVGKCVVITDKMKQSSLDKYGLKVGETFTTQKELANKIGKSEETIRQWRKKGWIT